MGSRSSAAAKPRQELASRAWQAGSGRTRITCLPAAIALIPTHPIALPRLPCSLYTDDGLRAKMAPLLATASDLTTDLSYMRELLKVGCARGVLAEW